MRLLGLLLLVAALGLGGRAGAHAQLVTADPPDGSVLAEVPAAVTLHFNEPVALLALRWFAPDGTLQDVAPNVAGPLVEVPVPAEPAKGTHVVSWRAASADGHPVGGSYVFSVGTATAAPGVAADTMQALLAAATGGLLTLCIVVAAGGAILRWLIDPDGPVTTADRLGRNAGFAAPVAALLALASHGFDMIGGTTLAEIPAALDAALASSFAFRAAALAGAGLLAAAAFTWRHATLAAAAWAVAGLSFAVSGHAAAAAPRWLAAPAVALHAAAFVFWLGALPGLAWRARSTAPLFPVLHRFARVATPIVGGLLLSGLVLAIVQVKRPEALVETPYGRLLLVKLVAVAALLSLAAVNRWGLTPRIAAGQQRAVSCFRRSVVAEIGLGLAILVLASGFRLIPPPQALGEEAETRLMLHGSEVMADLVLRPGAIGANGLEIRLMDSRHLPIRPLEVTVAVGQPDRGVEPIEIRAAPDGTLWRAEPVLLPFGGTWTLRVDVLIDDFRQERLDGVLVLPD